MAVRARKEVIRADVAVVGAGAAGIYAALSAARAGAEVTLVSRSPLAASASYWAQGGIAAALAADDSPELHAADTIAAGRGLCRASAVEVLCRDAPARVRELQELGVRFDADRTGALALGLEGGHSRRRVAHAGGAATGRRITRQLSALAAEHPSLRVLEGASANGLWVEDERCIGLALQPARASSPPCPPALLSGATILATGGAAALWSRTTNPRGAIGAGISLALAAGARVADLELVQFHPTALAVAGSYDGFLITEAVRGEGALLIGADGERFVDELAPRDVVSLAVQDELERTGAAAVGLDLRPVDMSRFPNIAATLRRAGIDPGAEPVPVAPAAHYLMGGVATDLEGRSSLPGLYAVGECACTGLHGANRMASNSLAECAVFAHRAVAASAGEPAPTASPRGQPVLAPSPAPPPAARAALWGLAGLRRTPAGLAELARHPFELAAAVGACGLARTESRGAHQRTDFPAEDPALDQTHTVLESLQAPRLERWD